MSEKIESVEETIIPTKKESVKETISAFVETLGKKEDIEKELTVEKTTKVKLDTINTTNKRKGDNVYINYSVLNGFLIEEGNLKVLKHNIKNNVNTMLVGATGVGKTELLYNIAKLLNKEITYFDMGTMTDPIMSLIGNHVISVENGKTISKFAPSRFSEVIQKPGIVVLDELSRASAGSNNLLFPCLDFRRELPMEYSFENRESIKIHPECVFIATSNTGSAYTGTHKLDKALQDRFTIIEIDSLNRDGINFIIKNQFPTLSVADQKSIIDIYFKINGLYEAFKLSFNLSIRHLKSIAKMVASGFTTYDAYYAICKGLAGPEFTSALSSIFDTKLISDEENSEKAEEEKTASV